ncbi:MAG: GTP 3',8-cyclase MoaA [Aquisalinus sp.]|nr:GTP 3',8-cyclase MoaA [Aquisalinus sp.]
MISETLYNNSQLIDGFGRQVTYLRLSVTDRCDLRCTYCMSEEMTFLPKAELLSFEELERLCSIFIQRGVKHLRISGGEPLTRKDIISLFHKMERHLTTGALQELTLTTNATQLEKYAEELYRLGVRRINVSLDTLDEKKFLEITRRNKLTSVLRGIDAALNAGLKVKINTVALRHKNVAELERMIRWAHSRQMDMSLIEAMPMGTIDEDRIDQFIPLSAVKDLLCETMTFQESTYKTSGPSRYVTVRETGGRLGFISPLSHNFCESCNRVRITCTGQLYTCLGNEGMIDLRSPLRADRTNEKLVRAIDQALLTKPRGHDFNISRRGQDPSVNRHMSVTGG